MLKQYIRNSFSPESSIFQIVVIGVVSLIVGLVVLKFSPIFAVAILVLPIFIFAVLKRPEIALLAILVATSSFIEESLLPLLSFGGISLHIPDLLLLGALGLIVIRWLAEPDFKLVHTPLDLPLIIFFVVTLISTIIAIAQSKLDLQTALRETRTLSYYLTFFIVTNLVRKDKQINLLVDGMMLLATIVAMFIIAQYFLGDTMEILPGYYGNLQTQSTVFEGVSRIVPPGRSILMVSIVTLFCMMIIESYRLKEWFKFLQFGLLGLSLLFTFLRSFWAAILFVFILLILLLRGGDEKKLFLWGVVIIFVAALVFLPVFAGSETPTAKLVGAAIDRFTTLFNAGTFQGEDSSFNWRMVENNYAISAIIDHPLLGLGMGFTYRPFDSRIDQTISAFDFRKFIHNGHLWILLQSGLVGYLSFIWLSFTFLIRGVRYWHSVTESRMRSIVLGFTLAYVAVLASAAVNSTFMSWYWPSTIGIMMGINEIILRKNISNKSEM